jgi:hypothetical protein
VTRLGEIVMILDLHRQDAGVSAIARRSELDRKTVRKVVAGGLEPPVCGPARGWACRTSFRASVGPLATSVSDRGGAGRGRPPTKRPILVRSMGLVGLLHGRH